MSKEIEISGKLTDDLRYIEIDRHQPLRNVLRYFKEKTLHLTVKVLRKNRSQAQNRWLWGVAYVTIAAWYKETQGEKVDKDALHAHTLQNILEYSLERKEVLGEEVFVVVGKSTSKLSTVEFSDMKDRLQAYWAERGCYIPDPREHNMLTDYADD